MNEALMNSSTQGFFYVRQEKDVYVKGTGLVSPIRESPDIIPG